MMIYEEPDKDNQNHNQNQTRNQQQQHQSSTSGSTISKCRRDLFPAFSQGLNSKPSSSCTSSHSNPLPSLAPNVVNLAQRSPPLLVQGEIYTYAYSSSGAAAASLGHCCQPQVCSVLLHALPPEYLYYAGGNRGLRSSGTSSSATAHSHNNNFVSQLSNGLPSPYRTVSHFGFNSPRQEPRMEHKHLPPTGTTEYIRYRAMHRGISYEEIFASPRYEQLCQPCFEQLLRLKPELQRRSAATSNSSGDEHAEDIVSYVSGSVTPQRLATLTELHDEDEYEEIYDISKCDAGTQTDELRQLHNFLLQIDRLNYSQESANPNYVPGQPSSPAESATSAIYFKSCPETRTNVTEVLNFGNWQEQQEQETQLPLTEHRITLEINQKFNADQEQQMERQLMSREERQRRKLEFEELWQDHVEYYGAKEDMQEGEEDKTLSNTIVYCTLPMVQQVETLNSNENPNQDQSENETLQQQEVLPQIIQNFEESLNAASENLVKLMVAAKKLQEPEEHDEPPKQNESLDSGSLFRAIDLENIPDADETASILEPERVILPAFSSSDEDDDEDHRVVLEEEPHDEKRDDEKPVTPSPEPIGKEKDFIECSHIDEKDVDENEYVEPLMDLSVPKIVVDDTSQEDLMPSSSMFSPLEREILERIQTDRLIERESIFGRIDESIRNKLTPFRTQCMERGDVEESFSTRTHIFKTPRSQAKEDTDAMTPHLFQFSSEPRPSAYSMHNIASSTSSEAAQHLRVITRKSPRRSRSWSTSNGRSHSSSSSSPTPSMTGSKSSLNRTISSTTFVARTSPRKKRNFILENIRNAGRQRHPSRTRKPPMQITTRDASTICAFQPDQGKFSTRLWVSLPTSPPNAIGHKRQSGAAVNSTSTSSCSGTAKRRRQIDGGISQTMSTKTFVPSAWTQEVSSDTYQLETELTSSDSVQPKEEDEGEEKRNNTNNSVYFSANDSATTDIPSSLSIQENMPRISGGKTISSEDVEASEEELSNPSQICLANNDQSVEHEIESNDTEINDEGNPPIALSASTANDTDPSLSVICLTSVEEIKDREQINKKKKHNEAIATSIEDGTSSSVCNLESRSSVLEMKGLIVAQDPKMENDGDEAIAREHIENYSSDYALNATQACIDLHTKPSATSTTSYDSNEFLLATEDNIHMPEKNDSEDDDKPVTSKAAARRNRRRLRKSKSSAGEKTDSKDSVVIKTKCTVRDGTLHLKEEESLDDIHPPRCGLKPYNDPFLPLYEVEILPEESEEEFDDLGGELLSFDLDLLEQLPEAAETEQLQLEHNSSSDKLNELSSFIVDLATSDEQILEICQNEENQAKDMAP